MKNFKKGSALVVVLVIIVIIIVGGLYYYFQKTKKPEVSDTTTNTPVAKNISTESWKTYSDSKSNTSFKYPETYTLVTGVENTALITPSVAEVAVSKQKPDPKNLTDKAVFFYRVCEDKNVDSACVLQDPMVSRDWFFTLDKLIARRYNSIVGKTINIDEYHSETYLGTTTVAGKIGYVIQDTNTTNGSYENTNILVENSTKIYVLGFPIQSPKSGTIEYEILSSFRFNK